MRGSDEGQVQNWHFNVRCMQQLHTLINRRSVTSCIIDCCKNNLALLN